MTKPPDTFGTQYANFTLSGSSLTSDLAKKWFPLVGVDPSLIFSRMVELVIPVICPFEVPLRCPAMLPFRLPFGLPMVEDGVPLTIMGLPGLVVIVMVVAILKVGL